MLNSPIVTGAVPMRPSDPAWSANLSWRDPPAVAPPCADFILGVVHVAKRYHVPVDPDGFPDVSALPRASHSRAGKLAAASYSTN